MGHKICLVKPPDTAKFPAWNFATSGFSPERFRVHAQLFGSLFKRPKHIYILSTIEPLRLAFEIPVGPNPDLICRTVDARSTLVHNLNPR